MLLKVIHAESNELLIGDYDTLLWPESEGVGFAVKSEEGESGVTAGCWEV